ncbi:MAG: hypothetical protein V4651_11090 [Bacteroidota bacterium]
MSSSIDDIILSFSREELRQFNYFLTRNGNTDKLKDIKLINTIRSGKSTNKGTTNVERQIRKRLKEQLEQFSLLDNLKYNANSEINSLLEVAKFLFRKNLHKHAWNYLIKAEEMAHQKQEYEQLDFIYYIQISYSSTVYIPNMSAPEIQGLIAKRNKNLLLAKIDSDANAAYALLFYEIREQLSKDPYFDIDILINAVFERFSLDSKVYKSPKIYARVVRIVCMALHEKKDYAQQKNYAMNSYKIMSRRKMLDRIPEELLMDLLFSIYTSAIKTKDYKIAEEFIGIYESKIEHFKMQQDQYLNYNVTGNINAADLFMFTGRLDEAKNRLQMLYNTYADQKQLAKTYFLIRINMLALYFKYNEYSRCIKIYNEMMQEKREKMLRIGGIEILLYTEIFGAMLHYENDDADFAHHLLGKIKKKYAILLSERKFKRERLFINIMEKIINDASYIDSKIFLRDLKTFDAFRTYVPGDKEYISLSAWLNSKLFKRTYYQLFMDSVNKE